MKIKTLIKILKRLPANAEIGIGHKLDVSRTLFRGDAKHGRGYRYGLEAK